MQALKALSTTMMFGTLALGPVASHAARWVLPEAHQGRLMIQNLNNQETIVTFRAFEPAGVREVAEKIQAREIKNFDVGFYGSPETRFLQLAEPTGRLLVRTGDFAATAPVPEGYSQSAEFTLPRAHAGMDVDLRLHNLSSQSQDGRILSRAPSGEWRLYRSLTLSGFGETNVSLPGSVGSAFRFEASLPVATHYRVSGMQWTRALPLVSHPTLDPEKTWFVVGNPQQDLGFVVGLDDETLITQAREQIANPNLFRPRILIASVNRNPLAMSFTNNYNPFSSSQHNWSWAVDSVSRFSEMASQSCDGNPFQLEDHAAWWQNSGRICFWSYQILRELVP